MIAQGAGHVRLLPVSNLPLQLVVALAEPLVSLSIRTDIA